MSDENKPKAPTPPSLDDLIAYESGLLNYDEETEFLQKLYASGLWTHLQGGYQRAVIAALQEGRIS